MSDPNTTVDWAKSTQPGEWHLADGSGPAMATVGWTDELAPEAVLYRLRRRYRRRGSVRVLKDIGAPDEWIAETRFEVTWPGLLTVVAFVADDRRFVHLVVDRHRPPESILDLLASITTSMWPKAPTS